MGSCVASELLCIDVDANELPVEANISDHEEIVVRLSELGADGQHDIGFSKLLANGGAGARASDGQWVAVGENALGIDGIDDGCLKLLRQGHHFVCRCDCPATDCDEWALGCTEQ